jgi:hypothetical protein
LAAGGVKGVGDDEQEQAREADADGSGGDGRGHGDLRCRRATSPASGRRLAENSVDREGVKRKKANHRGTEDTEDTEKRR